MRQGVEMIHAPSDAEADVQHERQRQRRCLSQRTRSGLEGMCGLLINENLTLSGAWITLSRVVSMRSCRKYSDE